MEGTAATTGTAAGASSHAINLPASIAAGEVLVCMYSLDSTIRYLTASGWTSTTGAFFTRMLYRVADGSEGATQTFNTNTGTAGLNGAVVRRFSGVDTGSPIGTPVEATEASEDPFTLSADILTSLGADSWVLLGWGGNPTADRAITTLDADLTLVGTSPSNRVHFAAETAPGSGNAAYSTDMASARAWDYVLVELKAAAGGGGSTQPPRSLHQFRMRRAA